jgi:AcrR family transcriptional regulator
MPSSPTQFLPEHLPAEVDLEELVSPPQQERSRRTLHGLVEAGYRLLESEGADALTVTRVAREAGTSVGSFYARFHGKEQLLRYMGELALGHTLAAWADAQGEGENPELAPLATFLVEAYRNGPLARLQALDGVEDPPPTRLSRFRDRSLEEIEARMGEAGSWCGPDSEAPWLAARLLLAGARILAKEEWNATGLDPAKELALALEAYLSSERAGIGSLEVREAAPNESLSPEPEVPVAPMQERPDDLPEEEPGVESQDELDGELEREPQLGLEGDGGTEREAEKGTEPEAEKETDPEGEEEAAEDDLPVDPFDVWG